jgi:hypothetical protein
VSTDLRIARRPIASASKGSNTIALGPNPCKDLPQETAIKKAASEPDPRRFWRPAEQVHAAENTWDPQCFGRTGEPALWSQSPDCRPGPRGDPPPDDSSPQATDPAGMRGNILGIDRFVNMLRGRVFGTIHDHSICRNGKPWHPLMSGRGFALHTPPSLAHQLPLPQQITSRVALSRRRLMASITSPGWHSLLDATGAGILGPQNVLR